MTGIVTAVRLKPEIRDAWAAALTSDEYRQGIGSLRFVGNDRVPASWCCLGVLCDLAAKAGVGEWHGEEFRANGRGSRSYPPIGVWNWAVEGNGAADVDDEPIFIHQGMTASLGQINDAGAPFSEIAAIIRERM